MTMETMIAYCGLMCTDCPGYIATQANDMVRLEQLAEQARVEYHVSNATVVSVMCDGCLSDSSRKCSYCSECTIRSCGVEHGVANCAYCPDYACEKLTGFLGMVPKARSVLDDIRATL